MKHDNGEKAWFRTILLLLLLLQTLTLGKEVKPKVTYLTDNSLP